MTLDVWFILVIYANHNAYLIIVLILIFVFTMLGNAQCLLLVLCSEIITGSAQSSI